MSTRGRSKSLSLRKMMESEVVNRTYSKIPDEDKSHGVAERIMEAFQFNYQNILELPVYNKENAKTHTEESPLWYSQLNHDPSISRTTPQLKPSSPAKQFTRKYESRWDCTRLVGRRRPLKFKPLVPYSSKGNALIMEAQEYLEIHEALTKVSKAKPKNNCMKKGLRLPEKHVKWPESSAVKGSQNRSQTIEEKKSSTSSFRLPKSFNWFIMNPQEQRRKKRSRRAPFQRPLCLRPPFRMKTYPFRNRLYGFSQLAGLLQETHDGVELLYDEAFCLASLGPKGIEEETKRQHREEMSANRTKFLKDQKAMETDELAWNLLARKFSYSFVPSLISVEKGMRKDVEIIYKVEGAIGDSESETELEPELFEELPDAQGFDVDGEETSACKLGEEDSNGNFHYWF